MKILLINHYAGSPELGMEFRPYYMAKKWQKLGHEVKIIGGSFSHLRKNQPNCSEQVIDGVSYHWLKVNEYSGNGVLRVFSIFVFVLQLLLKFKSVLKDFHPDIVIASSTYPLDVYPAKKIADYYNAKLIYEIHDLWPLSPIELGGMSPKHPFIQVMQWAENFAYQHVDAVVSILPNAEEHTREHGLKGDKFFCVPNGIVVEDWENPMKMPHEHYMFLNQLKSHNKTIIGFAGAHGIANCLHSVIDAVAQLLDKGVELILVGTGQEKENLIDYVQKKNIKNVHFLSPINKLAIPTLLQKMDILYIGLQKQSLFRFGISPNKIFDYMMAEKPIIQAIDAGNNLVKEANCGVYAEPENVEEIKLAIEKLLSMPEDERQKLGENGKDFVLQNHTYVVLAKRFIDIMERL